jgi:purine-nucleoside phosphorylase
LATQSSQDAEFPQIQAAAEAVRERFGQGDGGALAKVGVVLGSGLGMVADAVMEKGAGQDLPYGAIPHFPTSSVVGHKGRLVFGEVEGIPTLLMQGRVHRYEGYTPQQVVFPIRVLMALGVEKLILTNAAGGMGDGFVAGDLMLITDHLNMTGGNPLVGKNDDRLGPRFPDMSATYTPALRELARQKAKAQKLDLKEGVYAGMLGPSYETPAEIHMLKTVGASAVGMSTVYEATAAAHAGIDVLGISCITNLAAGLGQEKLSHDEVKETAQRVQDAFSKLVLGLIPDLA